MSTRLDADQVRFELGVERVIDAFGLQGKLRNGWYKFRVCPRCGEKSAREAIAVEASTGRWLHHGHERSSGGACSGDLFDFVAACSGLDTRRDFSAVVAKAAELAGMAAPEQEDPAVAERVKERLREREREEASERARRQAAAVDAAAYWDELADRSDAGEVYLTRRGLDPYPLIRAGVVRFTEAGDICTPLRSVSNQILTVATRFLEPGDRPKVLVRKGTTTRGSFVDAVESITSDRPVVVTEGLIDSLTAFQAWPKALVLGANGAGNLAKVVQSAIGRIRLARSRLLLVPHDDIAGIRAMVAAGEVALAAGLDLDKTLEVVGIPGKDLNDAWCLGWRPQGFAG